MTADMAHRVLVVEDEWIIAEHIAEALLDAGYAVVGPVGRIDEALQLFESERIDAALMDINVHGERSFGLAEQLAKASIPFAFLSGYAAVVLPPPLRGRPLMQKPVDETVLCRCVNFLLRDPAA